MEEHPDRSRPATIPTDRDLTSVPANIYAVPGLDRQADRRTDPQWLAEQRARPDTVVVPVLSDGHPVVRPGGGRPRPILPHASRFADLVPDAERWIFLGQDDEGRARFALDLAGLADVEAEATATALGEEGDDAMPRPEVLNLRGWGATLPGPIANLLIYARAIVLWHRRQKFCGVCGHPARAESGGHVRRCTNTNCATSHFPRLDAAVIVLVHDGGDRCLLGRSPRFPSGMYSTLAGFVEPGESLEAAVQREIREESRVDVWNVRYHSSQPWPFPSSLMVGFFAMAEPGLVERIDDELEDVAWFRRDWLLANADRGPIKLPIGDSIARRLILDWLHERF